MTGFFRELAARWRLGYPVGQGYRIRQLSRDEFQVSREGFAINVYAELLSGPLHREIDAKLADHWLPPHQEIEVSAAERREVLSLVKRYFGRIGQKARVSGDSS